MSGGPSALYHIAVAEEWEATAGAYAPRAFAVEGFIHCSTAEQVMRVADTFFSGRSDLVLLTIDARRVAKHLRYESAEPGGESFPHVYAPLERGAVIAVQRLALRADGTFEPFDSRSLT
jgi:uncharacterized protein (DUF952 family)